MGEFYGWTHDLCTDFFTLPGSGRAEVAQHLSLITGPCVQQREETRGGTPGQAGNAYSVEILRATFDSAVSAITPSRTAAPKPCTWMQ